VTSRKLLQSFHSTELYIYFILLIYICWLYIFFLLFLKIVKIVFTASCVLEYQLPGGFSAIMDSLETNTYFCMVFVLPFGVYFLDGVYSRSYCRLYLLGVVIYLAFFVKYRFTFAPVSCVCCSPYAM
jgi:hypothetical protein